MVGAAALVLRRMAVVICGALDAPRAMAESV
jgi:hypothetical protein